MSSFFEPSPAVLAWLITRKFIWAELIVLLALARLALGPGGARGLALLATLGAGAVVATIAAPALGLTGAPLYAPALALTNHAQGLTALLLPSLALLGCFAWRWRAARAIEWTALAITLLGAGLWTTTQL